jgi:hypothetical protein
MDGQPPIIAVWVPDLPTSFRGGFPSQPYPPLADTCVSGSPLPNLGEGLGVRARLKGFSNNLLGKYGIVGFKLWLELFISLLDLNGAYFYNPV